MLSEIVDLNIVKYINNCQKINDDKLGQLQKECYKDDIPIIDQETSKFLEFLLTVAKPVKILEIGTAVGFSAILMSKFLGSSGKIVTIDRAPKMIEKAEKNFKEFKVLDKITFLKGDAGEILKELDEKFDFIFMDAGKGQYIQILPDVLRLLNTGGIIFTDDIFQNGNIVKNIEEIPRRQRTIHRRLNQFIKVMTSTKGLRTSIIPLADGILLSYKEEENIIL